jgi:hypothetical protein
VPSLHVGVALAVSVALAATTRRRWLQGVALLWAPLVTLAVIATGNHYAFDVVTGALTAAVGYALGRRVPALVVSPARSDRNPLPAAYRAVSQMPDHVRTLRSPGDHDDSTYDDDRADVRWLGRLPERRTPARAFPRHRRQVAGGAVPEQRHQRPQLTAVPGRAGAPLSGASHPPG